MALSLAQKVARERSQRISRAMAMGEAPRITDVDRVTGLLSRLSHGEPTSYVFLRRHRRIVARYLLHKMTQSQLDSIRTQPEGVPLPREGACSLEEIG